MKQDGTRIPPHPAFIAATLARRAWLLLVPTARVVLHGLVPSVPAAARSDVLVASVICAVTVWQYRACRYCFYSDPDAVCVRQGIAVRRTLYLAMQDAATASLEKTPLLRALGAVRVRIGTAGLRYKADAVLYLSQHTEKRLFPKRGAAPPTYRTRTLPILLLGISGSNAAVGLLTAAPALRQMGKLLGTDIPKTAQALLWQAALPSLSSLLIAAGNLLLAGWGFSFIRTLERTAGFCAYREGGRIRLCSGWLTRRTVLIDVRRITALELRQTLLMRLCGLQSAVITAAGYGRDTGARPILIPAATEKQLVAALGRLLGDFPVCHSLLRPASGHLWRYIQLPCLTLALGAPLPFLAGRLGALLFAVWTVFCVWWTAVRCFGYRRAGIGINRRAVSVRCYRGLALYEIHIPSEVTDAVTVSRSVWQRRNGTCTVTVRCFGEKHRRYRVPALPYTLLLQLLQQLEG